MTGVVKLVTAATDEPVTRTEIKVWLRIDEHEVSEDPLLDSLVARARQRFEEVTQRACLVQTFDYYLDEMPDYDCALDLPKAPLVAVTSIKGFQTSESNDAGGTAMSTSGYYVDTAREFGRVAPLSTFTYPTATREINAAIIRFTAGYSTSTTGVPDGVKTEIKQIVAALYEHRGDEVEQARIIEAYGGAEYALPTWG
jgi:uncharacterized phiE125 gp8 family phage protein